MFDITEMHYIKKVCSKPLLSDSPGPVQGLFLDGQIDGENEAYSGKSVYRGKVHYRLCNWVALIGK